MGTARAEFNSPGRKGTKPVSCDKSTLLYRTRGLYKSQTAIAPDINERWPGTRVRANTGGLCAHVARRLGHIDKIRYFVNGH